MHSFTRFSTLAESFTQSDIAKFKSDAQAWTKNVRRIANGKELATVAAAYDRWQKWLDEFIYKRVIGTLPDAESSWSVDLRKKMWMLVITNPFREDLGGDVRRAWEQDRGAYTSAADMWDAGYRVFDTKRESVYAKLGRVVRDAVKSLDYYFDAEAKQGRVPDHAMTDHFQIEGLPVTLMSDEAKSTRIVGVQETLTHLRTGIQAVRKAGFGKYLAHLRFELRTDESHAYAAGLYNHRSNDHSFVQLFVWGSNVRTIVHEIGHHVHALLSPRRRDAWLSFIREHRCVFTDEDFANLHKAFIAAFDAHQEDGHGYTISGFWAKHVPRYITDKDTLEKYRQFHVSGQGVTAQNHDFLDPFKDEGKKTRDASWEEFRKAASVPFTVHMPSEYASKNEDEAFAEVFCYYVLKSAPIDRITRATFEDVVFS